MLEMIIAFAVGGIFGVGVMCCCFVTSKEEKMREKEGNKDRADIS